MEEQHSVELSDYTLSIRGFHFHLQFSALGEMFKMYHHGSEHTDQQSRTLKDGEDVSLTALLTSRIVTDSKLTAG